VDRPGVVNREDDRELYGRTAPEPDTLPDPLHSADGERGS